MKAESATEVERLAEFAVAARWAAVSDAARDALKKRVLDALGCAIGALDGPPVIGILEQVSELGGNPSCTLIGGGRSSADRAALYNGAAVRYLDFNDAYLAKGETCHPSDNVAPLLAAAEYADVDGSEFLTALAVAYQVQCRLSDVAPVRARGFDHTVQGAYAVAAGVSRALQLDAALAANAIAIAGTAFNALRVTRTGALSNWKGLAYPHMASCVVNAAFLAKHGITGPSAVFEGNKGFMETIAGPFQIHWSMEDLEAVTRTDIKRFNAEFHAQTALEAILELRTNPGFDPGSVSRVEIDIFDVAYHIIGGGEEGDKQAVRTKEEADHSLPYMAAVAILDGVVTPEQYQPSRIARADVQHLLRRIVVRPDPGLSAQFPAHHACRVAVHFGDGRVLQREKTDYQGFHTRPASWETLEEKFLQLSRGRCSGDLAAQLIDAVHRLDQLPVSNVTGLLARVSREQTATVSGRRR